MEHARPATEADLEELVALWRRAVDEIAVQRGGAMLSVILTRGGEWGLTGIDAPALPGNRDAKAFFERHGMRARLLVMHRPLAGAE